MTTPKAFPPQARTEVHMTVLRQAGHAVVKPHGELDIATAPALRERLTGLLRPGIRLLVLDLSGVTFCDAAGLAVLVGTRRRANPRGIVMLLAAPGPQVLRVLRATGLERSLPVRATVAEALAEPVPDEVAGSRSPLSASAVR
ncbi:STAS domain-containing protein [Actinomadura rubrisoli]|nr:STAS domain-containing protein [Actinomadura rubrisoli]